MWLLRYASGQTDRHADRNTSPTYRGRSKNTEVYVVHILLKIFYCITNLLLLQVLLPPPPPPPLLFRGCISRCTCVSWSSLGPPRREALEISGTEFFYKLCVLPATQQSDSKHCREHKAQTLTSGLAASFSLLTVGLMMEGALHLLLQLSSGDTINCTTKHLVLSDYLRTSMPASHLLLLVVVVFIARRIAARKMKSNRMWDVTNFNVTLANWLLERMSSLNFAPGSGRALFLRSATMFHYRFNGPG